ncbi:chorismate mutase [Acidisphaera sp. L21]|uniref:chorismate mutase n=1 Tax=Acidisphaera sp. L21 TaxID=1641851 RepID=UPI00131B0ACA|nr:chorismate mutase [Acidisphaera sp. L21]
MSSTVPPVGAPTDLASLRAELDRLDDELHTMLVQRAQVVEKVGQLAVKGRVALRAGREAAIVRRLVGNHTGRFPVANLVRVWREILGGMTALQGTYSLAICDPDPGGAYTAIAREHFGALIPLRTYRTPAQAIGEISAGTASAAVLPAPTEWEEPSAAWWTALLHKDDPRIHVTACLPFWAPRPEGAPKVQALVVSAAPPDPSGADRSLLGLEMALDQSRARFAQGLAASGFDAGTTVLRRDPGAGSARVLVDVAGFVPETDPRLASLTFTTRPPIVLGAYAVPIEGPAQP